MRLLTDPVLRPRLMHLRRHGPPAPDPGHVDAVLISHLHYDHLDLPSLRRLAPRPRMLCPRGARAMLARSGFEEVEELAPGESAEVGGVPVQATPADHPGDRRPGGPRAEAMGFVIRRGRSVYFAGDTDLFDGMARLGPVDVALLPVAGWGPRLGPGHLNAERAAHAVALVAPRVAVPIHWGTLHPRSARRGAWFHDPPHVFAAQVAALAPGVEVRVLAPGESLSL